MNNIYTDLTTAAHRAYNRGVQTGSGGNVSVRIKDMSGSMVVKSSGGSFGDCTADGKGWVTMNFDGSHDTAHDKPTREWRLHAALLKHLTNIDAVMHCHAPWSISWADTHDSLPLVTWHSQLKMVVEVPVFDVRAAVVPDEELFDIVEVFKAEVPPAGIILKGHGIVTVGRTAVEAEHALELIEETAQIATLTALLKKEQ